MYADNHCHVLKTRTNEERNDFLLNGGDTLGVHFSFPLKQTIPEHELRKHRASKQRGWD